MFTITKLKMWKNPGYTQGCVEVPPSGSKKLPIPDWTSSEDLRPRRGSTLSEIELPLSYLEVYEMSYLYIEAKDGKTPANTIKIFGWILGVEETASGNEAVKITWTPDYWRTYSDKAVYGPGRMIRTSDASKRRPSEFHPIMYTPSLVKEIADFYQGTQRQSWCYFRAIKTVGGISNAFLYAFPIGADFGPDGVPAKTGISLQDIYAGALDEYLQITSSTITGIWISNIAPGNYPWNSNESHFTTPSASITGLGNYGALKIDELSQMTYYEKIDLGSNLKSDDLITYAVIDASGRTIATLPWGKEFRYMYVQLDIGSVGAYLRITFSTSATFPVDATRLAGSEGLQVQIPLINVPLTSNAWTDYNFSGQRDYEIEVAKLQNEEQAWKGVASAGQSGIGGAIAGASAGPIGAIAGGFAGLGMGLISPGVNYLIGDIYRDKTQGALDNYYSKQANNLLVPAEGAGWYISTTSAKLISLNADSQSASDYSQMIANDGYNCDCALTGAGSASAIATGGPLKIINFNVTGPIPPSAKQSIKLMLEAGIRIIENNPSGVVP